MRRAILLLNKNYTRGSLVAASVLASSIIAFSNTPAFAEYSVDAHCFKNGVSTDILYPEDLYANGEMQNEIEVEAVQELTRGQWKMRLSTLPFNIERGDWRQHSGSKFSWFSAGSSIALERAQRLANRRTGSKYFYISPNMKNLARQRGLVRNFKRKPCNPNITYLGTN